MADEQYTFTQARNRLEDIVVQVRKKDVSLEHSLDLLEEGVKLAAACTELIDSTEWRSVVDELRSEGSDEANPGDSGAQSGDLSQAGAEAAAPDDGPPVVPVVASSDASGSTHQSVEIVDAEASAHDDSARGTS